MYLVWGRCGSKFHCSFSCIHFTTVCKESCVWACLPRGRAWGLSIRQNVSVSFELSCSLKSGRVRSIWEEVSLLPSSILFSALRWLLFSRYSDIGLWETCVMTELAWRLRDPTSHSQASAGLGVETVNARRPGGDFSALLLAHKVDILLLMRVPSCMG